MVKILARCCPTPLRSGDASQHRRERGKDLINAYISKKIEYAKEASAIESEINHTIEDELRIGHLFGYPLCCIKEYLKHPHLNDEERIVNSLKNSKRYFWELNNFNWSSPYYLISHFPCKYDCEKSLNSARKLLGRIEKKYPLFFCELKEFLREDFEMRLKQKIYGKIGKL